MTDEQLIQQIEQALADLKADDESARDRLIDLLSEESTVEKIAGDRIDISSIENSAAVAVGRGARAVIYQRTDLPPEIVARLVALADYLEMQGVPVPPPLPDGVPAVAKGKDDYIFISYARPDQPIAEGVEEYLKRAGFRVFRDTSILRTGDNWDMVIEKALRETGRMVLLLSQHSMPYRKEVHREWFYYDQNRKPIHPLYLRKCDLHSRLYAYHYMPIGDDLYGALRRLAAELGEPFDPVPDVNPRDRIVIDEAAGRRPLPEAMDDLLRAIRGEVDYAALSPSQVEEIEQHSPQDVTAYRLGRVAEWSQRRYRLDERFVALTLLLDQGEEAQQRWVMPTSEVTRRFTDLREVMTNLKDNPALALLGVPGSGKSTLLRRLQLDDAIDRLRDDDGQHISFFISLNGYRPKTPGGSLPSPYDWLVENWTKRYPDLPSLGDALSRGRVLLLLDALNEMPHKNAQEYAERVGLWQQFIAEHIGNGRGNRAIFSCRSLDYSSSLSCPELRVPQVVVQPMSPEQVQQFLHAYLPARADAIWTELENSPQFDLFRTPYFLKLLTEQVETAGDIPEGRAGLFTGFVRETLHREVVEYRNQLFAPDSLLTERDHRRLAQNKWRSPFDLPERGLLLPKLSHLAFAMQQKEGETGTEGAQVRIGYDDACELLQEACDADILRAGVALNVLDEDITQGEILFFHQLLQEFFAARRLAREPNPELVRVEWRADRVSPTLAEKLKELADSDPLPPLPATGWEETTVLAAAMAEDPPAFIRGVMDANLPLAARCATNPEAKIDEALKDEIRQALIARTQDKAADLRARIAAGEALGELGDPRFERRKGEQGDYLMPPLVSIPAGEYPVGDDEAPYDQEKHAHTVELAAFQIGQFPVTNAEYALFMAAGGYEDERWWDTGAARAWLRGEGSAEGLRQQASEVRAAARRVLASGQLWALVPERLTSEQAKAYEQIAEMTDNEFEEQLGAWFPEGQTYRQPEFWDDTRFNNPLQPVVGVTWFEARAYCNWLAAQTGKPFRLPTEVEREAAARGQEGRTYAYGPDFNPALCNTFETHVRRTTPVGVFPGGETPEGGCDLSGNMWDWTSTIYDQDRFPYRYRPDDGREDLEAGGYRVVRGGSWLGSRGSARCSVRYWFFPFNRLYFVGFRVVVVGCSPSL